MEKRVSVKNNAGDCVGELSDAPRCVRRIGRTAVIFSQAFDKSPLCAYRKLYLASHIGGQRPETTA